MTILRSPCITLVLVLTMTTTMMMVSIPCCVARRSPSNRRAHRATTSRPPFALWSLVQRDGRSAGTKDELPSTKKNNINDKKNNKNKSSSNNKTSKTLRPSYPGQYPPQGEEEVDEGEYLVSSSYERFDDGDDGLIHQSSSMDVPRNDNTPFVPPNVNVHSLLQIPCSVEMQPDQEPFYSSYDPIPVTPSSPARCTRLFTIVDTGAQVTVLSYQAAQKAGVLHLMDRRYGGHAAGVGNCRVLGRIPENTLHLHVKGTKFKAPAVLVLEHMQTGVELLLGLDFLKRTSATLSLSRNEMTLMRCQSDTGLVGGRHGGEASSILVPFSSSNKQDFASHVGYDDHDTGRRPRSLYDRHDHNHDEDYQDDYYYDDPDEEEDYPSLHATASSYHAATSRGGHSPLHSYGSGGGASPYDDEGEDKFDDYSLSQNHGDGQDDVIDMSGV